ncbi:MAG: iron-sulfur cluster assembly protein [Nanoarchaeota archaeon]|nr:iron-sulfur cluster assembly protein [Nanoarchaeota archaeon]
MITKEELIEDVFKKYIDPELGIDVWTLGLVYNVEIQEDTVKILLTFTSPLCPYGPQMVDELKEMIINKRAKEVDIVVTFEPPWQPSEELKEMMGMG